MEQFHTVEDVADLLGLHVKTVRGYVRDGRLRATKLGTRYRIAAADLAAFTGRPAPRTPAPATRRADVRAFVRVEAIDRVTTQRIDVVMSAAVTASRPGSRLNVHSAYDEERAVLEIVLLGGLDPVSGALDLVEAVVNDSPTADDTEGNT